MFALFSLVTCLPAPAHASDFYDSSNITPYSPQDARHVSVEGASVSYYPDYLWIQTQGKHVNVSNFSTTKGLAKPGDILAISIYRYDAEDSFLSGDGAGHGVARIIASDGVNWTAYGKPGYSQLLSVRGNTAYFKCVNADYCWVEGVAKLQRNYFALGSPNHQERVPTYVVSSYIISGDAAKDQQVASKELEQFKALEGQDQTGNVQQQGLNNAAYTQKGTSLVSALTRVANAPASSCRVDAPVHGANFSFDFCSSSRPSWLRPLISIPVAVTSLMLSIHIIKATFREIERFKAGI